MEHRWGKRMLANIPIRLKAPRSFLVRSGRLANLSVSGAFIVAEFDLRVFSTVQVVIESPLPPDQTAAVIAAYVSRRSLDGIGVEWCDLAPPAVIALLRAVNAQPYAHLGERVPVAQPGLRSSGGDLP